ncbi:RNA polymerase sigma factor [Luteipulveratus flavus]|uniref:Sigma-70 family RNA polymerase sigma factor n=1 Tax=Luteipulveratus flavus TaxID=3031728 RepID=A0ABT6C314_9MICO|nr:sigma-70 family RNA polymerase sigma factor [Luteipulveratus sp. YIM 133296]MDF8263225.1 sigma-70 family RNA polymerase sigma factor [Luteipulveratus sp. YIM 133296]
MNQLADVAVIGADESCARTAPSAPPVEVVEPPKHPPPDVEQLAESLRDGSRQALAQAYAQWAGLVHTVALRSLGDRQDAEDVTQQVFVSAWRSRHTLRPSPTALPGWLIGITRHRVSDVLDQRRRAHRNGEALAREPVRTTDDGQDRLVDRLLVTHEVDGLGEPRATIIRMAFVLDLPYPVIAARLDLPLATVKSHVRRGLLQLRAALAESGDRPD